jgi:hypothetical protein
MKLSEVGDRINAARGYRKAGRTSLLPHLRWELKQVMSRVRPEDLSANEIAELLAVLTPAHCRVIGGPSGRPGATVSGGGSEKASSEFA